MDKRWCFACGMAFEPRAQSPRQAYCNSEECQRARKSLWQRTKRKTDSDYYQNQLEAQKVWRQKHPEYWRNYRDSHPEYTLENRNRQLGRNERRPRTSAAIAKSDASSSFFPSSGLFRLVEVEGEEMISGRSWTVRLTLLSPEAEQ